jgi:hypothetical protein
MVDQAHFGTMSMLRTDVNEILLRTANPHVMLFFKTLITSAQ